MKEYKKGFASDFKIEDKEKEIQVQLRKKHNIENVVVVEKKFMKYLISFLKLMITIIVFILVTIGLISVIYKNPRSEIYDIVINAFYLKEIL